MSHVSPDDVLRLPSSNSAAGAVGACARRAAVRSFRSTASCACLGATWWLAMYLLRGAAHSSSAAYDPVRCMPTRLVLVADPLIYFDVAIALSRVLYSRRRSSGV